MEVSNRAEGLKETYDVAGRDFSSAGAASSRIKRILQQIGVDQGIIRRIAVSSYEAEMNLVIHASNGGRITLDISPDAVTILVEDDGPGITDIKKAMQPGYSTASDEIREMGFGAGMGLPNMQSCADELEISSEPGVGTTLKMVFMNR
ncbi:MAG TPA: anti-sigma regulatory factor [Armatimonadota bacterium]|nr:anti-sigma regulatory factor [Armatimonadota bacterium]HOP80226.1 anti-sigma regulatory factor [Armatimonadota bacterium]